jgi:hypothetical protein
MNGESDIILNKKQLHLNFTYMIIRKKISVWKVLGVTSRVRSL